MLKSYEFIFNFISKGFWHVNTTVTNPAFNEYIEAFQPWIESVRGSLFTKDLDGKLLKGRVGNFQ